MGTGSSKDMAIGLVIFNPAKTKRMIMNYLYVVNEMRSQGIPVFTLELCFGNAEPEILDSIVVRGNSYMFHKERLCRILEEEIPKSYRKIAFLDADILFERGDWYSETSKLLNTHDVVQPFEDCTWLDLTYTNSILKRKTVLHMPGQVWDWKFHPGFAWAFRRDWYRKVGFYDYAVTGSGDTLSSAAWLGKVFPANFPSLPESLQPSDSEFRRKPRPRITYLKGNIFHLYHGSRENRKYVERHSMLNTRYDIRKLTRINRDGVFEWMEPHLWNSKMLDYFVKRNDDDISSVSNGSLQSLQGSVGTRVQVPVQPGLLCEASSS